VPRSSVHLRPLTVHRRRHTRLPLGSWEQRVLGPVQREFQGQRGRFQRKREVPGKRVPRAKGDSGELGCLVAGGFQEFQGTPVTVPGLKWRRPPGGLRRRE